MTADRDAILSEIASLWATGADPDKPYWDGRAEHHDRLADLYQKLSAASDTGERLALLDAVSYRRHEADLARQQSADEKAASGTREGADR